VARRAGDGAAGATGAAVTGSGAGCVSTGADCGDPNVEGANADDVNGHEADAALASPASAVAPMVAGVAAGDVVAEPVAPGEAAGAD